MNQQQDQNLGYTPEEHKKFTHHAWRYLLLFSFLYCCIYCMRLNLANAGLMMKAGLNWTDAEIGILTAVLSWSYGIGHLFNGRICEIFGPAKFVIASVVLSFIANMLMGFSSSLVVMAIIWGFNGYFQSMAWTPGLATLTNWWPSKQRGLAVGFAHAFSGFGQALVILAVAGAYELSETFGWDLGWRAAFFLPPLIPAAMLVVYLLFAKSRPEKIGLPPYKEDVAKSAEELEMAESLKSRGALYPYKHLLSNYRFIIWMIIAFIMGIARYGLATWVPIYFNHTFEIEVTESILGSLALPVGMAMGTLIVPPITDRFCPNNRLPAVIISALLSAAAVLGFLALNPRNPVEMILIQVLLFIAGLGIYAVNGLAFTFATTTGGRVFAGTASGMMDFAVYMGAATQALVYGFISEQIGWKWVFYTIVFFCALMAALALLGRDKKAAAK